MEGRVLVGMSGGIDSTAVCHILKSMGYDVVGLTIRNVDIPSRLVQDTDGSLEPDFVKEARELAARLSIEHYVADERQAFQTDVVQPFIDGYLAGLTPNPCVNCNLLFKFRVLCEWADRLGCQYVATGHYARLVSDGGYTWVERGADQLKDQSYFLWRLGQDVLSRTIFPLGDRSKADIRRYLSENDFEVKSKGKESMEVCFIENNYRELLRQRVPDIDSRIGPGKFVGTDGKVIGMHKGYPFYTVGQRKGLVVAFGKPAYVLRTNAVKNTVMLGWPRDLDAHDMFVEQSEFVGLNRGEFPSDPELLVRIRYRSSMLPCHLEHIHGEERVMVRFHSTASAITPGQSAVFYRGDRVVGGAVIALQRGINQYISTNGSNDVI